MTGSGQDGATLTVEVVCGGTILGARGETLCLFEGPEDVYYSAGTVGWTCEVCGKDNEMEWP